MSKIWLLHVVIGSLLKKNAKITCVCERKLSPARAGVKGHNDDLQYYTAWSWYTHYKSEIHFVDN